MDLSSPKGISVNDEIDRALCPLSNITVENIVTLAVRQSRGGQQAKFGLEAAYRKVPVHPQDRQLLGMEWKGQVLVDTKLISHSDSDQHRKFSMQWQMAYNG